MVKLNLSKAQKSSSSRRPNNVQIQFLFLALVGSHAAPEIFWTVNLNDFNTAV